MEYFILNVYLMNKIFKRNILLPVAFNLEVLCVTHGMKLMCFMITVG